MNDSKPRALITGASSGLGAEFARQLAAQGYDLILLARRRDRLESLARELPVESYIVTADLSQPSAPASVVAELEAQGLHVDLLVNNAGIAGPDLLLDRDWPEQQEFLQLMMVSPAALCHLLVPKMVEKGEGAVINVASVAGRIPRSGPCHYGAVKAYLVMLSEELNLTVAAHGVKVTALCPGFTHTEFHEVAGLENMKAALPTWIWYDADVVVRDALNGVARGRPIVISGRLYRWLDPFLQSVWTRRLFRIRARPGI